MGRKKAVHPADAYRRKLRKQALKKNKKERQQSRHASLRKKSENDLVDEIQKINSSENSGLADTKMLVRRRQLLEAFTEVQKKKKALEKAAHQAKTVTVKGLGKIMGQPMPTKDELGKENLLTTPEVDLEFPPGIPLNPKLQRPPGITPRPQNSRRTRTFLKKKDLNESQRPQAPPRRNFGNAEILNPNKMALMNKKNMRRKGQMASEMFDPLNPASPFYLDRPGQQMPGRGLPPTQPAPPQRPQPVPPRQIGPQPGPRPIGPNMGPGPMGPGATPALAPGPAPQGPMAPQGARPQLGPGGPGAPSQGFFGYGPGAAGMAGPRPSVPSNYPGANKQKLEVLLSEDMKLLIPTALRVKRKAPATRRGKKKALDIAPDVGGAKAAKKGVASKKKGGMAVNHAYEDFLNDLGDLA